MKTRKTACLGLLILLIGLVGCSTPGSSPTPNRIRFRSYPRVQSLMALTSSCLSRDLISPATLITLVRRMGLETVFISFGYKFRQQHAAHRSDPCRFIGELHRGGSVRTDGGPDGRYPPVEVKFVSFQVTALSQGGTQISSISPTGAVAGSPDLTLTIMGSSFDGTGVIRSRAVWVANGSTIPLSTTFVSDTLLTAVIPSALLTDPGSPSGGAAL